jgi:hypothetical protein
MSNLFLSASVPLPKRDERFLRTADIVAIREAVKGLVDAIVPTGTIVFGGHPAITPLVALLLRSHGESARKRVVLYQSAYFSRKFVDENAEFVDFRLVPAVAKNRQRSLAKMRKRMIEDTKFDAAVFIGGMKGVIDEFEMFKSAHPDAQRWPVASTGAAALELFDRDGKPYAKLLAKEMTYSTMFRSLIRGLPA